jgi:hypothetical protein
MKARIELAEVNSQSHSKRARTPSQQRTGNDSIEKGILVFIILFFALAAIGLSVGGAITVSISSTVAATLFAASVCVLKMLYGVVRMLFGYPPTTFILRLGATDQGEINSFEEQSAPDPRPRSPS